MVDWMLLYGYTKPVRERVLPPPRPAQQEKAEVTATVLNCVEKNQGSSIDEIVAATGLDRSTVTPVLGSLLRKGRVEREIPKGGGPRRYSALGASAIPAQATVGAKVYGALKELGYADVEAVAQASGLSVKQTKQALRALAGAGFARRVKSVLTRGSWRTVWTYEELQRP